MAKRKLDSDDLMEKEPKRSAKENVERDDEIFAEFLQHSRSPLATELNLISSKATNNLEIDSQAIYNNFNLPQIQTNPLKKKIFDTERCTFFFF